MSHYITIKHPVTGEEIKVVPTGKVNDFKAECQVISPNSKLDKVWIEQNDIPTPPLDT